MLQHLILNGRLEAAYHFHHVSPRGFKEELLSLFGKGRRKDFIRLFSLLRNEEKLEFYVRVYFLIYNIHPAIKSKGAIPEEEIAAFREFLETKGADLAKTNEFLQFYALSYVKKPLEHPSYKTLFKKDWINNLSEKLTLFLQDEEKRMRGSAPEEVQGRGSPEMRSAEGGGVGGWKELEAKNKMLFDEVEAFKRKYHELERNNQGLIQSFNCHLMESQNKWFQITRELTSNAKVLVDLIARSNSKLVLDRRYHRIKKRTEKFQKIVKKELDQLLNQSQDISVFDKPSANEISCSASVTPNLSQRNLTTFVTLDEFIPTNYVALIRDFRKMADGQKVQVLQGLSWRIIKSRNKWLRRQTIVGMVLNDVLGLANGDIQLLMFNSALTLHVLQLFSFISEDSYGRRVLFRNMGLYKELLDLVPEVLKNTNYECLDLILSIIVNIWHTKDIYRELINLNIIDIYINSLLQSRQIVANDSLLESIVTILVHSASSEEGLAAYEEQVNVFYYLTEAFRLASDSNRNLIGGIIFTLLGRKNLWKLAHEAQLPSFIGDMLQVDRRVNKQQLKLIQSKLYAFQPGETLNSNQLQDQDSLDTDLEEENFQRNEDELQDLEGHIKGHEMLAAKYPLRNKDAEKQLQQINQIISAPETTQLAPVKAKLEHKEHKEHKEQHKEQHKEHKEQQKEAAGKEHKEAAGKEQHKETAGKEQHKETAGKEQHKEHKETAGNNAQRQKSVHFPEIKKRKESMEVFNPKAKNQNQEAVKNKMEEAKDYYSYKSPNFKQNQYKSVVSAQVERLEFMQEGRKPKIHSFQNDSAEAKGAHRVLTKPQDSSNEASSRKEDLKKPQDRRSSEKPDYRIKKSSSVEKGLSYPYKKQTVPSETNKNNSNVADYKSIQGVKSPAQKKSREEVLKQLNQELKAEKRVEERERKLSSKHIPAHQSNARENTYMKKNNFVAAEEDAKAFESKPKLRRTPPQDDK